MDELLKQVQTLSETQDIVIRRQEQMFKLQEERLNSFLQRAETLKETQERLDVTIAALTTSLSENDRQLDDLATVTAGLMKMYQQLLQSKAAS